MSITILLQHLDPVRAPLRERQRKSCAREPDPPVMVVALTLLVPGSKHSSAVSCNSTFARG